MIEAIFAFISFVCAWALVDFGLRAVRSIVMLACHLDHGHHHEPAVVCACPCHKMKAPESPAARDAISSTEQRQYIEKSGVMHYCGDGEERTLCGVSSSVAFFLTARIESVTCSDCIALYRAGQWRAPSV